MSKFVYTGYTTTPNPAPWDDDVRPRLLITWGELDTRRAVLVEDNEVVVESLRQDAMGTPYWHKRAPDDLYGDWHLVADPALGARFNPNETKGVQLEDEGSRAIFPVKTVPAGRVFSSLWSGQASVWAEDDCWERANDDQTCSLAIGLMCRWLGGDPSVVATALAR
mgnify:CR=1 FL=1